MDIQGYGGRPRPYRFPTVARWRLSEAPIRSAFPCRKACDRTLAQPYRTPHRRESPLEGGGSGFGSVTSRVFEAEVDYAYVPRDMVVRR
jgi:hypothetical protein